MYTGLPELRSVDKASQAEGWSVPKELNETKPSKPLESSSRAHKTQQDIILTKQELLQNRYRAGDVVQSIECLPGMHES